MLNYIIVTLLFFFVNVIACDYLTGVPGLQFFFFFQAEDGIRDWSVTGVQTCALPISSLRSGGVQAARRRARSASSTTRSRHRDSTSSRITSPSSTSASGPPTADSGAT